MKRIVLYSFFLLAFNLVSLSQNYNKLEYPGGYSTLKHDILSKSPYYALRKNEVGIYGTDSVIIKLKFNENFKITQIDIITQTDSILARSIVHNFMVNSQWQKKQPNEEITSSETVLRILTYRPYNRNKYNIYKWYIWNILDSEGENISIMGIRELSSEIFNTKPLKTFVLPKESQVIINNQLNNGYEYLFSKKLAQISLDYFINDFNKNNSKSKYLLKFEYELNNQVNYAWLTVKNINSFVFTGSISVLIPKTTNLSIGDIYKVRKESIIDWKIITDKKITGNFSNRINRNTTILNRSNKLFKYINQDTINKYSQIADIQLIEGVYLNPDNPATYNYYNMQSFFYDNVKQRDITEDIGSTYLYITDFSEDDSFFISFFILPTGKILNPKILNGNTKKHSELINIISNIGKWKPATNNGEKVISYKTIKLTFNYIYE